jgi:hypothetical protein
MKKSLFSLIPALALVLLATSCSKESASSSNTTVEGKWVGTGQYGTTPGDPTYPFTLTFKADGTVSIIGNNNAGPDTATGTWELVQDSVKASYTYNAGTALYKFSGKFSSSSNLMVGTIGLGAYTSGIGLFSVTKQ